MVAPVRWNDLCAYIKTLFQCLHILQELNLGVFFDAGGHDFVIPDALPLLLFFKCNVN